MNELIFSKTIFGKTILSKFGSMRLPNPLRTALMGLAAVLLVPMSACHSHHIDATVENHTGGPIQLLEVDYPSASFGADQLAADAVFHYRIQLRGSGPIKVQYTAGRGIQAQMTGPVFDEPQEGTLEIVLLPGGKAEFHPHLSAHP